MASPTPRWAPGCGLAREFNPGVVARPLAAPRAPQRRPGAIPGSAAIRRSSRASSAVARARHRGGRRWWQDAWEDDSSPFDFGGAGLDGGPAPAGGEEQVTTIFCSDGSIVRLGMQPHPLQAAERRRAQRAGSLDPLPLPGEQGLCIGSVFSISATNGIDTARRLNLLGFCFSTEQLYERVEDCVLSRGGEVFETQRKLKSGVHECLHMSVAIPYLWGVPPEYERLKAGIKTGGGIIDRIEQRWLFL